MTLVYGSADGQVVGKTGMGKTPLIQNTLADDIAAGRGVCLVDPQINDETADAVWWIVGSIIAFQVGHEDAEVIARQLGKYPGQITKENLSGLPKYAAHACLLIEGKLLQASRWLCRPSTC